MGKDTLWNFTAKGYKEIAKLAEKTDSYIRSYAGNNEKEEKEENIDQNADFNSYENGSSFENESENHKTFYQKTR